MLICVFIRFLKSENLHRPIVQCIKLLQYCRKIPPIQYDLLTTFIIWSIQNPTTCWYFSHRFYEDQYIHSFIHLLIFGLYHIRRTNERWYRKLISNRGAFDDYYVLILENINWNIIKFKDCTYGISWPRTACDCHPVQSLWEVRELWRPTKELIFNDQFVPYNQFWFVKQQVRKSRNICVIASGSKRRNSTFLLNFL